MRLIPEATESDVRGITDALETLPAAIPEILSYSIGCDLGLAEDNFDICLVADFSDQDGYETYSANAEHQAIIASLIRPLLAGRSAVQHVVD